MHELPLPPPRRPVGAGKSRNIAWHTHQRWTAEERAWKFASSVFRAHRPDHLVLGAVAVCPCLRPARDCEILRAAAEPDAEERAGLLVVAGRLATAAGWVRRRDGRWLCPTHADLYLAREPRRFTVRECLDRHRRVP